jgi:Domain of unknown function (DUF4149)
VFRWIFRFVLALSLAVWVGSIVFFSAVVAPDAFGVLGRSAAGTFLSRIFPHYYLLGAACGLAALAATVLLLLFDSGFRLLRAVQLAVLVLMLAGNVYAGTILEGRIHRLREEREGTLNRTSKGVIERQFARLHRRSVTLNLGVLALGVVGLGSAVERRKG